MASPDPGAPLNEDAPAAAALSSCPELRLVLLGKTGTGKSSSGNIILGREAFQADISPESITSQCERESEVVSGRHLVVIDTPGFFDTRFSPKEVATEVGRCVVLSSPGPHAFLVVLQPGRFTQEEQHTLKWISATFGAEALRYTMVLFTWGDQLKGRPIEEFLKKGKELSDFVGTCKGGYHVFDNSKSPEDARSQVSELLCKIDKMVEENGGGCYTSDMYQEAERAIQEAQQMILLGTQLEREQDSQSQETEATHGGGGGGGGGGRDDGERDRRREEERKRREAEEARKKAERVFWSELLTAMGKGAAEGAGLIKEGEEMAGEKKIKKGKVVKRATALASKPLSITSAAKVVGGAVREGSKVLYKHRKTFLQ
ncbi:GTPase IMAP family member 9-like [Engraulis encrasicolus]|uniref:GTPase IMAP family member 9-like n=1 Tax=Engraulis encrasicolus TaxID=184585 RepID=UPI002FD15F46